MSKKELSQYEVIKRLLRQEINGPKAAELLNITSRHIREDPNFFLTKNNAAAEKIVMSEIKLSEGSRRLLIW